MRALLPLLLLAALAPTPAEAGTTLRRMTGTFELRYDPRDCLAPLCGGYFLVPVNHDRMTCADRTVADQCYVAEIDWDALGWTPQDVADLTAAAGRGPVMVRGRLEERTYPAGPWDLGVLVPRMAFVRWLPRVP